MQTNYRANHRTKTIPTAGRDVQPKTAPFMVEYTDGVTRLEAEQWACLGADPELFWPTTEEALTEAAALCSRCPARAACARRGAEAREWGVWGGLLLNRGKPTGELFPVTKPERIPVAVSA